MGKILWLASYPKSGNTWLRAFIHNLFRNADQPYDINRLESLTLGEAQAGWYRQFTDRPVESLTPAEVMDLRPKVHALLGRQSPDTVLVKTHNANLVFDGKPLVTEGMTAGMIYVVRNPLDVCLSFADHFGLTIDETIDVMADRNAVFPTRGETVFEYGGSWSLHVESWTVQDSLPQLHVMRYEDMLDSPRRTFGGLAGFLGVPAKPERLQKAIKLSSFKVLRNLESQKGFIERSEHSQRFFRVGRKDQWREVLTKDQIGRIVETHRTQMVRFKYVPAGY